MKNQYIFLKPVWNVALNYLSANIYKHIKEDKYQIRIEHGINNKSLHIQNFADKEILETEIDKHTNFYNHVASLISYLKARKIYNDKTLIK